MINDLVNTYFVKNTAEGSWTDITALFDGVRILKVSGFLKKGKPVNIYTAQWIDEQEEDFMVTTLDENERPVVVRENIDIEITFIIRQKYATNTINVKQVHDAFIDYMTGSDVWVKSAYMDNAYVHCVCLEEYEPTVVKLQRGENSWALGTLKLHTLDAPVSANS